MKRKLIALLILISLLLGGCSLRLSSPDVLIRPPKPYGDNKGLQEALESVIKERYTLEAPLSGDYRSAYILYDFDGDGEEEALAFYQPGSSNRQIKMNILDKEDGKWVSKYDVTGTGVSVDRVSFSHMSNQEVPEILVSWNLFNSKEKKMLTIWQCSYDSNHTLRLSNIKKMEFTSMQVADLDRNGLDELLLLNLDKTSATPSANAQLYRMNAQLQMEKMDETKMDGGITSYESIQVENTPSASGNPRVYIDSLKGEASMVTEVVYWDSNLKKLIAPLYDSQKDTALQISRSNLYTCRDINNDGILEIPLQTYMAGADVMDKEIKDGVNLTQWVRLDEKGELVKVTVGAVNAASFYMFSLPEAWWGDVYIKNNAESRTWTFYEWDPVNQRLGKELLSIATVAQSSWQKKPLEGYTKVKVNQNLVYAAKVARDGNVPVLTFQQIEENLQIFE